MALKDLNENPKGASISTIAEKNDLSKNSLSKILQTLHKKGLLSSAQGVKGGYKLTKEAQDVSFFDLLLALDEIKPLTCNTDKGCEREHLCGIKSPLKEWENRFLNFLSQTSVEDLIADRTILANTKNYTLNSRSL